MNLPRVTLDLDKRVPTTQPVIRRLNLAYVKWRKAVLERDNHICQHCGAARRLHAHHIKSWAAFPDLRHDVSNGLTLCKSCHRKEHKRLRRAALNKPLPRAHAGAAHGMPECSAVMIPLPVFGAVTPALRRWLIALVMRGSGLIYVPRSLWPIVTNAEC
jgi:hypothetical protein